MTDLKPPQKTSENNECLDLSSKRIYVLVFFAASDPGHEYEIFSGKDIEWLSWRCLTEGDIVRIKYGTARSEGIVVKVSDNFRSLKKNFNRFVKTHKESLKTKDTRIMSRKEYILQKRKYTESINAAKYEMPTNGYVLTKNYIKSEHTTITENKETQTDHSPSDDNTNLKKEYEELKTKYRKMYSLVSDLQKNIEDSLSKLASFKMSANENTAAHDEDKENIDEFSKMIQIGSRGTKISKQVYDSINWSSYTTATRKLLITLFPRKVLATHSLTGKPSPAFLTRHKEAKARLNPDIISDIVQVVSKRSRVPETLVRSAITTKCADENKLYKKRVQKGSEEEEEVFVSGKKRREYLTGPVDGILRF